MKSNYRISRLLVALALQAIAVLAVFSVHATTARVTKFSEKDAGKVIALDANTVVELVLRGNLSTGYDWYPTVSNSNIEVLGEYYTDDKVPEGYVGQSGTKHIYIVGKMEGSASVALKFRRYNSEEVERTLVYSFKSGGAFKAEFEVPTDETLVQSTPVIMGEPNSALPKKFNWCGGYPSVELCTPVRDQGSCGSCWAFATIAIFETIVKIRDNLDDLNLSEQFLVSCGGQGGCDGGTSYSLTYLVNRVNPDDGGEPGAPLESTMPYTASDGTCAGPYPKAAKGTDWGSTGNAATVEKIKENIYAHGPVWATVYAGGAFGRYSSGIVKNSVTTTANHAIAIIGWDETDPKSTGYWYVKNSWGSGWGESGYGRFEYGANNLAGGTGWIAYGEPKDTDSETDSDSDSDTDSDVDSDGDSDTDTDGDSDSDSDSDSDTDTDESDTGSSSSCGCTYTDAPEANVLQMLIDLAID